MQDVIKQIFRIESETVPIEGHRLWEYRLKITNNDYYTIPINYHGI